MDDKFDDELNAMIKGLPQYDVPEQLTQRIITSVAEQPARKLHSDLLAPTAVAAAALMGAMLPFDTVEGIASTAICVFALYVIQMMIKSAQTEEMVA